MLGVRPRLLQHLGSGGRALLHRVHPQPLPHLRGPVHRREALPQVPEHHDRAQGRGGAARGVGVVHGHLRGTAAGMEGAAARGRQRLPDHGGARLRALLLPLLLLPAAHGHPHHVLQGLRGGPQDHQEPGGGRQARAGQVDGSGPPDPLSQRAGGRARGQLQVQQKPPVPELAVGAADEVLQGEAGGEDPRHRGGDVHPLLAAVFLLPAHGYVTSLRSVFHFKLQCIDLSLSA